MTTQTSKVTIGTLIHGTLRDRDLLPAFVAELERLDTDGSHTKLIRRVEGIIQVQNDENKHPLDWEYFTDTARDDVAYLVNEVLPDALNEYALPHTYFGTLEGDGSDFGFWADVDSFEDCDKHVMETPSSLRGDTEWFDLDCGVIVQVNDHGNVTVSQPYCDIENHKPNGTNLCEVGVCLVAGHEIWSAV